MATVNHWPERLNRMTKPERKLAHKVLAYLAEAPSLSVSAWLNLKEAPDFVDVNASFVIKSLIHDGYIYLNDNQAYQFTSPMLKKWWCHYAAK